MDELYHNHSLFLNQIILQNPFLGKLQCVVGGWQNRLFGIFLRIPINMIIQAQPELGLGQTPVIINHSICTGGFRPKY